MKKNFITYLFYGLLGGIGLFLLEIYDVYHHTPAWPYLILYVSIPFVPMFLRRLKKSKQRSFSTLFKLGIIVSLLSIVSFTIISQSYPRLFISQEQKTMLVDEKVNRMIMDFDGSKIDIFAMEERALHFFETKPSKALLELLLLIPVFIFLCTLFALILKTEIKDDEEETRV